MTRKFTAFSAAITVVVALWWWAFPALHYNREMERFQRALPAVTAQPAFAREWKSRLAALEGSPFAGAGYWTAVAACHVGTSSWDAALDAYARALSVEYRPDLLLMMAEIEARIGRLSDAEHHLREANARAPLLVQQRAAHLLHLLD